MKSNRFLGIFLLTAALFSCGNAEKFDVSWISPTGIPTLPFFDEGDNQNWLSTSSPSDFIPAAFASNNFDAIVFDGVSGLTNIKANKRNYALARWISRGTFYLVSNKHEAGETINPEWTIDAFVRNGNASMALNHLQKEVWKWNLPDSNISFETGVDMVRTNILSNPNSFDYFLVAEPVLTSLKQSLPNLKVIYDLQEQWKGTYNKEIPAAALFVNKSSYESHKPELTSFIEKLDRNIITAIDNPLEATSYLEEYENSHQENPGAVAQRFGFTVNLAKALQKDGANKFGLVKNADIPSLSSIANDFLETLGSQTRFDESCFLS